MLAQREQMLALEKLGQDLAELRLEIERMHINHSASSLPEVAPQWLVATEDRGLSILFALFAGFGIALALLVASHWLLIVRHDAAAPVFRAVSIGIPFAVAVIIPGLWRPRISLLLASGAALGISAVVIMSYVISLQDGTPIFPTTARDFYDMVEFAISIMLGFLSGALAVRVFRQVRDDRLHLAARQSVEGALSKASLKNGGMNAAEWKSVAEAGAPILALLGSLLSGFRSLF